jgi:alkanesulfonate monooxygenase SsuD/methylene tetrahydromethanopterin reductase-like flavin-dependent oxidoreductase (luciferase family)
MEQVGARPGSWLRSIEETTLAVRHILRGEPVTTHGEYVRLENVRLHQAPSQVPPILLGVRGEKSLRLAGAVAEGALLAEGSPPDYVRWAIERMQQGRRIADRNETIETIVYVHSLVDQRDRGAMMKRARSIVAAMVGDGSSPSVAQSPYADKITGIIERGGEHGLRDAMPDAWIHDMALAGTLDDALAAVSRYIDAGATGIVLVPPEDAVVDEWLEQQAWAVAG